MNAQGQTLVQRCLKDEQFEVTHHMVPEFSRWEELHLGHIIYMKIDRII